ncbi:4Fe-4S dicluster domain-containing protein [Mycoplasmatota bacterium zrk1]
MGKVINIKESRDFLNPDKVYIPLASVNSKYYDLLVYEGDEVKLGEKVAERFGEVKTPIFSSVSGEVIGVEELEYHSGIVVDHLVIKNDKKDTVHEDIKPIEGELTARNIQRKIEELGIKGLAQRGLYTRFEFSKTVDHLFVNAVYQNEPFVKVDPELLSSYQNEIVEGVKLLAKASLAEVSVLVSKNEDDSIYVNEGIKTIKVNPKRIGVWHICAISKAVGKELSHDLLDDRIMFVSSDTARAVYNAVTKGMPVVETDVLVVGDALNSNSHYNIKIGTHVEELVQDLGVIEDTEEVSVYIGSILSGRTMQSTNFACTEFINFIGVDTPVKGEPQVCTKCGRCNDICPVDILPQNVMDAELRMLDNRIFELDVSKCIECGLCSYVCPSEINVLEWVRRAKRRIK